ncbi:MAG: OmpA family protein [Prevotellaceae bacterium]|jgi:outer membrane protein OmpA-like peptidoglycan-associated protein|nr:OmpA family protein [Prevotellaceae bacterium]
MKKINVLLRVPVIALFVVSATAPMRAQIGSLPQNEFTINLFGGLSTLNYQIDNTDFKMGYGGGVGLGFHYFFNNHVGIVTGLEAAMYNASVSTNSILSYDESQNKAFTLNDFKETQSLIALQLPIMLQFTQPIGLTKHLFIALGARGGYSLLGGYRQSASSVTYPDYAVTHVAGVVDLGNYSDNGSIKFLPFNVMGAAELGVRWKLGGNKALYTGLYFDYGLMDIKPELSVNPIFYTSNNTSEEMDYSTTSILEAKQYQREGNVGYVQQKVTNFAGGIKIKFAFGSSKKNTPSAPKPKREPKPAPAPKPTPAPAPVKEIPQEIMQAMMNLSNLLFEFDRFNLTNEAIVELNKVVKWLKDNPTLKVEIEGHTDNYGTPEYNQPLSENRAKSVYNYFVENGVSASRLTYRGYGLTRPIATNATAEGRKQNRRVELRIVE